MKKIFYNYSFNECHPSDDFSAPVKKKFYPLKFIDNRFEIQFSRVMYRLKKKFSFLCIIIFSALAGLAQKSD
jgi:hypothetical protein